MSELVLAVGLVLALEGLFYAAFPNLVKAMMVKALEMPDTVLRNGGLIAMGVGVGLIWLVRG
jgi:uncharacterized protein YjeT (DUF2065 family)